jgi:hypothetical protein
MCPWGAKEKFSISAKLNSAYIALGLLCGDGDLQKTVDISTRAGQDSDCNPGNAGGVIGTLLGFQALPESAKSALKPYMDVKSAAAGSVRGVGMEGVVLQVFVFASYASTVARAS